MVLVDLLFSIKTCWDVTAPYFISPKVKLMDLRKDIVIRSQEANRRIWEASQRRIERIKETKLQNEIQIVPPKPVEFNIPAFLRGAVSRLCQARGSLKLLRFTFQFGRLKIEFSRGQRSYDHKA